MDLTDTKMILIDAIRMDDPELLDRIIVRLRQQNEVLYIDISDFLETKSSVSILSRVLDSQFIELRKSIDDQYLDRLLKHLTEWYDEEDAISIVSQTTWRATAQTYRYAATRGWYKMVKELKERVQHRESSYPFWRGLIPSRPNEYLETFALECFELYETGVKKNQSTWALGQVVETCRSIPLALFFVQKGANVEEPGRSNQKRPLLFTATRRNTFESIQMARFLIKHGADPTATYRKERLQDTPAGGNVRKWTGMSWDEFVEDAQNSTG